MALLSKQKVSLPLDADTAGELNQLFDEGDLFNFAKRNALTAAHFLVEDVHGITPLRWAYETGQIDRALRLLQVLGEKLTAAHFLMKDEEGAHR